MPVSDTTTVLSKLFTALIVPAAIVVAVAIATQIVLLLLATVILLIGGANPASIWGGQLLQMTVAIVYWQLSVALWYAPVAAWLLLVSAWAKRVTILWALLTPLAIVVFERVAIGTHYVQDVINARMSDPVLTTYLSHQRGAGFTVNDQGLDAHGFKMPHSVFDGIDPVAFLSNPWLWVGLVVAAVFVAAAIWMRRYREPL
jgi:ABC-2 type transport system permease protein